MMSNFGAFRFEEVWALLDEVKNSGFGVENLGQTVSSRD